MKNKLPFLSLLYVGISSCMLQSVYAQTPPVASMPTVSSPTPSTMSQEGYLSSNYDALTPKPSLGIVSAPEPKKEEKKDKTSNLTNENLAARGRLSHHPTEPLLTPLELDNILEKYQIIGKKFNPNCEASNKSSGAEICMKDLESYFENRNVRLRVLKPNAMTTMEYSMNRISFHINDKNEIINVQVG